MSEQNRYRRMTLGDVERVMNIEREVYRFPWTERIFRDCIRVGYHCWLAFGEHELIGHAVISVAAGECHILNLSIAARHQNHGHGKRFIEFLVGEARKRGAHTMLLEVRPSNTAAIQCYQGVGFNQIGSRKDYYPAVGGREDALLFARDVPAATSSTLAG